MIQARGRNQRPGPAGDETIDFRLITEYAHDWIFAIDNDGRFAYVSPACTEITGHTPSEFLADPDLLESIIHPEDAAKYRAHRLDDADDAELELRIVRLDGETRWIAHHCRRIFDSIGKPIGRRGSNRDITAQKKAETELVGYRQHLEELVTQRTAELTEAQRKSDAANAAKSAFLANMSHEIRTPMNAILGLSHLLQRRIEDPDQRAWLDKIHMAGQHLLALINDILDLSKIEAGKLSLAETDFLLGTVLDQVRSLIQSGAEAKGLRIEIVGEQTSLWLRGDPMRLRQALLNYAGNAVKFTDRGFVRLRTNVIRNDDDGCMLRFSVEDSGCGIAPEILPKLFTPFVQADSSSTRANGGTGLGLAITRRLAELMGGDAGADSEPGSGSSFWFTCRLKHGTAHVSEMPSLSHAEADLRRLHAGARLLLVEDDRINRLVAQEMLGDTGLAVDTAENGVDAIAKARANRYDLILMDIQMPLMNGLEATRALRELPACRDTPIIAMTANAHAADHTQCLAAGMVDFVPKPVDPDDLYAVLFKWLEKISASSGQD